MLGWPFQCIALKNMMAAMPNNIFPLIERAVADEAGVAVPPTLLVLLAGDVVVALLTGVLNGVLYRLLDAMDDIALYGLLYGLLHGVLYGALYGEVTEDVLVGMLLGLLTDTGIVPSHVYSAVQKPLHGPLDW